MTTSPWCREKVMVYLYLFIYVPFHRIFQKQSNPIGWDGENASTNRVAQCSESVHKYQDNFLEKFCIEFQIFYWCWVFVNTAHIFKVSLSTCHTSWVSARAWCAPTFPNRSYSLNGVWGFIAPNWDTHVGVHTNEGYRSTRDGAAKILYVRVSSKK